MENGAHLGPRASLHALVAFIVEAPAGAGRSCHDLMGARGGWSTVGNPSTAAGAPRRNKRAMTHSCFQLDMELLMRYCSRYSTRGAWGWRTSLVYILVTTSARRRECRVPIAWQSDAVPQACDGVVRHPRAQQVRRYCRWRLSLARACRDWRCVERVRARDVAEVTTRARSWCCAPAPDVTRNAGFVARAKRTGLHVWRFVRRIHGRVPPVGGGANLRLMRCSRTGRGNHTCCLGG